MQIYKILFPFPCFGLPFLLFVGYEFSYPWGWNLLSGCTTFDSRVRIFVPIWVLFSVTTPRPTAKLGTIFRTRERGLSAFCRCAFRSIVWYEFSYPRWLGCSPSQVSAPLVRGCSISSPRAPLSVGYDFSYPYGFCFLSQLRIPR